jgi:uncharacterized protein (DUF4415 family)
MIEKTIGEVRFELDPDDLPTMNDEALARLRAMNDEDIDLTDISEQGGKPGRRVSGPRFGAPPAAVVLDRHVLRFFHETGGASAARINAVLREYAEAHR